MGLVVRRARQEQPGSQERLVSSARSVRRARSGRREFQERQVQRARQVRRGWLVLSVRKVCQVRQVPKALKVPWGRRVLRVTQARRVLRVTQARLAQRGRQERRERSDRLVPSVPSVPSAPSARLAQKARQARLVEPPVLLASLSRRSSSTRRAANSRCSSASRSDEADSVGGSLRGGSDGDIRWGTHRVPDPALPLAVTVTKVTDFVRNLLGKAEAKVPKWAWNLLALVLGVIIALGFEINLIAPIAAAIPALKDWTPDSTMAAILSVLAIGAMVTWWHEDG